MRVLLHVGMLVGIFVVAAGCGGSAGQTACVPGAQQACACPGGAAGGAQACTADGKGFEECSGCPSSDGSAAVVDMSGDDTAPPPDLATPTVQCGQVSCMPNTACCETAGQEPACRLGETACAADQMGGLCDRNADCAAFQVCCGGLSYENGMTYGGSSSCSGPAECAASIAPDPSGNGTNHLLTHVCHVDSDCAGLTGPSPVGSSTAFDHCCSAANYPFMLCAPANSGVPGVTCP